MVDGMLPLWDNDNQEYFFVWVKKECIDIWGSGVKYVIYVNDENEPYEPLSLWMKDWISQGNWFDDYYFNEDLTFLWKQMRWKMGLQIYSWFSEESKKNAKTQGS